MHIIVLTLFEIFLFLSADENGNIDIGAIQVLLLLSSLLLLLSLSLLYKVYMCLII